MPFRLFVFSWRKDATRKTEKTKWHNPATIMLWYTVYCFYAGVQGGNTDLSWYRRLRGPQTTKYSHKEQHSTANINRDDPCRMSHRQAVRLKVSDL